MPIETCSPRRRSSFHSNDEARPQRGNRVNHAITLPLTRPTAWLSLLAAPQPCLNHRSGEPSGCAVARLKLRYRLGQAEPFSKADARKASPCCLRRRQRRASFIEGLRTYETSTHLKNACLSCNLSAYKIAVKSLIFSQKQIGEKNGLPHQV